MNLNWLFIPTILSAFGCFKVGNYIFSKYKSPWVKTILFIISIILALPGLLFAIFYLHFFDNAKWFYEYRSISFTEITAAGAGLLAGGLYILTKNFKIVSKTFILIILLLGIIIPYSKPVIAPLRLDSFKDKWVDNICIQSTPSSCGAASAATLLKAEGEDASESKLAKECYTYEGGTENWYIARAFRRRGFEVEYIITKNLPDPIPYPAICGVRLGNIGHFIPLIGKINGRYVVGDPLIGKRVYNKEELLKKYAFTGFFMKIIKRANK